MIKNSHVLQNQITDHYGYKLLHKILSTIFFRYSHKSQLVLNTTKLKFKHKFYGPSWFKGKHYNTGKTNMPKI